MDRKRGLVTQLIRHLIQLVAFILSPGLFIVVFAAVRDLLTAALEGSFSIGRLSSQILTVFTVFLIAALWGRFFCGFLCSFGMMQEILFFFSGRMVSGKVRIPAGADYVMKVIKYFILFFIIAGVWILALPVDDSLDPWGVFGRLVSGNLSIASAAIPTAGFALLLAICFASFFVERFFCRYLCPLGAMFAMVSGRRLYKIRRQKAACTDCGLCVRQCSMGIAIPAKEAVTSGECIQCMQCIAVCPKECLSANPAGAIAGTAAAAAMGGMVAVGNLLTVPAVQPEPNMQVIQNAQKGKYKDGVYTGAGKGFRGDTEVRVTVENGYIADITVLSFADDREFFNRAQTFVIGEILTEQIPDVSPVSGATFSSNSIMDAVAAALESGRAGDGLEQAGDGQTLSDDESAGSDADQFAGEKGTFAQQPAEGGVKTDGEQEASAGKETMQSEGKGLTDLDNEEEQDAEADGGGIADGIYEGTGRGLRGNTRVSVTVENGLISDITVVSYADDEAFFNRAKNTVISEIIKAQYTNVQAVSGATFSSNSIMDAVASALGSGASGEEKSSGGGSGQGTDQPAREGNSSGAGQPSGEGNAQEADQPAGEGNGQGAGRPEGGDNAQGAGRPEGGGNGQGAGQPEGGGNGQGPGPHAGEGNGAGSGPKGAGRHGGGNRGNGGHNGGRGGRNGG